jgi:hypothetical protein
MSEDKNSKMIVDEFNITVGKHYASDLAARSLSSRLLGTETEIHAFIGKAHPKGITGYIQTKYPPGCTQLLPDVEYLHGWLQELLQHAIDTAARYPTLVSSTDEVCEAQGAHLDNELALEETRQELARAQAKLKELEETRHKAFLQGSRSGKQAILDKLRADHEALQMKREKLVVARRKHEQGVVETDQQLRIVDSDEGQARYILGVVEQMVENTEK